jgi:hypothetical protein
MSQETALEELWANAGTQFDPRVVSALASVIRTNAHVEASPALDVRGVLARNAAIIGGPPARLSLSARPLPPQ